MFLHLLSILLPFPPIAPHPQQPSFLHHPKAISISICHARKAMGTLVCCI